MATDRARLIEGTLGDLARLPPGPLPQMWWQWELDVRPLPHDSARAAQLLDVAGWKDSDGDGVREKGGVKLAFRLATPTTSAIRRMYAQLLQAQYRGFGVDVQIDELDNTVLGERAQTGQFDAALASWQTDPSAISSLPEIWTASGSGGNNWGRYHDPVFEALLEQATAASREESRRLWQVALRRLNEEAAGIWLYAVSNVATIHSRIADVRIRPDSWWALVRTWKIPPDRQIERDRRER
jgi:peptide/nickel transport system substrate-binding protein